MELGATRDEALSQCRNDQAAAKRIQEGYESEEKLLHFVSPKEISRLEVRLKEQSSSDYDSTFQINVVLYDKANRAASTEGKMTVEFTPDISAGMQRTYNVYRNTFRLTDAGVPYQPLSSFSISKARNTIPSDEIRVSVNFSDLVSGEASIHVEKESETTSNDSTEELLEETGSEDE
jgi:hypothetical protein